MCSLAVLAMLAIAPLGFAQDEGPRPGGGRPGGGGAAQNSDDNLLPWDRATEGYTKSAGSVSVWRKDDSLYFEIPSALLGRDFLWQIEAKETPSGGYNGTAAGDSVVRWDRRENRILLRKMFFNNRAISDGAISRAVAQSNVNPIVRAFPIRSVSPEGNVLIDVSSIFLSDVPELSARQLFGGGNMDRSRTFVERVNAFPENVNIDILATFTGGAAPAAAAFGGGGGLGRGAGSQPSNTGVVNHSIVLLPETPMMGRLFDSRVGYFSNRYTAYTNDFPGTKAEAFINRYRLEKKDPSAAISEPVKPIVYYISPEVPEKWRPFVKAGVEDWNEAFEAAGFRNAIICKEAPENDPTWSSEDVRYSMIRWAPLPIANAMGPSVTDPRSGEIISAHIIMWHDVLKLGDQWYFAQSSANDRRAQSHPFPDELTGELLRFVVAHEVGHTLGLPHNGKGSAMVPTEWLRDPKWTNENGTATTIMDYARFNYVAQPGDGARLIPKIGPYDKFSIEWGYKPIAGASNPYAEVMTLDKWAAQMVDNPMLRFYDNFNSADPTAQSEALGDDAVKASTYGVMNLKRSMGYLLPGMVKLGEDYSEMNRFWGSLTSQMRTYIGHVVTVVGGVEQIDYRGGRGGDVYHPVSPQRQKEAVKWIVDNVLTTPTWMVPKDITNKLGSDGGTSQVLAMQLGALGGLTQDARLTRMVQNQVHQGSAAYTVPMMMRDIRQGVFGSVEGRNFTLDVYQRNLQRAYVQALMPRMAPDATVARPYAVAEMEALRALLSSAAGRAGDEESRIHLRDLARMAEWALANPDKVAPPAAAATAAPQGRGGMSCWICDHHLL